MSLIRLLACALAAMLLAGCGSMNLVSDGADSKLMLKGCDPVAYFTDGRPVRGRPDIKTDQESVPGFLGLANAFSALYPKGSEEKRLIDAMLVAVPR